MEPRSYLPNCPLGSKGLLKGTGGHMGPGFVSVVLIRISATNQLKHDRHWTSGEPGASGDIKLFLAQCPLLRIFINMAFALISLPVCVCLLACVHTSVWPLCGSASASMPIYVYCVCQRVLGCLVDSACLLVYISSVYLLRAQDSSTLDWPSLSWASFLPSFRTLDLTTMTTMTSSVPLNRDYLQHASFSALRKSWGCKAWKGKPVDKSQLLCITLVLSDLGVTDD